MARQIIGHIDLAKPRPQVQITYPNKFRDALLAEGTGHMVVWIDTETLELHAEPVSEDVP